jgi:GTP cyclohydrolase I
MNDPMITDRIPAADHRLPGDGVGCGCGTHAVQRTDLGTSAGDGHSGHGALARAGLGVDHARIERAVREILFAIGEDPARDGLRDTPRRVAKAYAEVFGGLRQCASEHLGRVFEQKSDELITVTGIGFHSMCEHHLLPFFGKAHVAYLPQGGRVVGLSKLARTVEVFAKRPQLQERLTEQVADAMMDHLDPAGCIVMVEAEHLCMKMRGVKTADSVMTTFVRRGVFRSDEARGDRAMALVRDLAAKVRV